MSVLLLSFLIGIVAGLRSMTAPAAVSWAVWLGWLHVRGSPLEFLGFAATPWVITFLAMGEMVGDKLPNAPSRRSVVGFTGRIMTGALCGAAFGVSSGGAPSGAAREYLLKTVVAGVLGAIAGTLGGYKWRMGLVDAISSRRSRHDFPVALLEDLIAIGGALLIVSR